MNRDRMKSKDRAKPTTAASRPVVDATARIRAPANARLSTDPRLNNSHIPHEAPSPSLSGQALLPFQGTNIVRNLWNSLQSLIDRRKRTHPDSDNDLNPNINLGPQGGKTGEYVDDPAIAIEGDGAPDAASRRTTDGA